MDAQMIQWLVGQAGISGLAAFALYTLNTNHQAALRREQEYAEANREDKNQMLHVLSENTSAMTKLSGLIEAVVRGTGRTGTGT